jgi:acetate kinase
MSILVLNAGSSSLKFALFDGRAELAGGVIQWTGDGRQATLKLSLPAAARQETQAEVPDHVSAVRHAGRLLAAAGLSAEQQRVAAVGHRVVHGGIRLRQSVRIDDAVKRQIAELAELAPLHNPPALDGINAAQQALPNVPHVAVFDTAFYAGLPPHAYVYPVPYQWYEQWGVRRFGFHGISHAYCAGRAAEFYPDRKRIVICHLGNGCSASAVRDGVCVATTMGFTPLEGLMMGSRSGSVDPGLLLYLQRRHGLGAEQLDHALNHESGLLGVSGVSSDYRSVEQAAAAGNERARLALAIFADRVRAAVGALAVTLGGVDVLVFTAGIGEHAAGLRAAVCAGLECLGLVLDAERNRQAKPDAEVAAEASAGRILVLATQEDLLIAREVAALVSGGKTANTESP